jgi:uncharacterized repeat protein (TIGR03803 family)
MTRSHSRCGLALVLTAALPLVPGVARAQTVVTTLHSFSDSSPTDGAFPESELIQAADGDFYGTTYRSGALGLGGTVFKMTAAGAVTVLHAFTGGPSDGAQLRAGLVQGKDGNFYGTTQEGGAFGQGTVFTMTPAGAVTVLHSFAGGADGANPTAALIEGSDGNFYGTTFGGGPSDTGTVFRMTPGGNLTVLHAFTDFTAAAPATALGSRRPTAAFTGRPIPAAPSTTARCSG